MFLPSSLSFALMMGAPSKEGKYLWFPSEQDFFSEICHLSSGTTIQLIMPELARLRLAEDCLYESQLL